MKISPILLALGLSCCGPGAELATVALSLDAIPARVASLTVTVVDVEQNKVVATATAARGQTRFELGVPAEVLLELRAVARTDRPGPSATGGVMPAYVARARRTVKLGRDIQEISLVAVPAGLLTFAFDSPLSDPIRLQFREPLERTVLAELPIAAGRPGPMTMVLPSGHLSAEVVDAEADPADLPILAGGEGLYVARESESLAVFTLEPPTDPLAPDEARTLELRLSDERGPLVLGTPVLTSTGALQSLNISVVALDQLGQTVEEADARVELSVLSQPGARRSQGELRRGFPAAWTFPVGGLGRLLIEVRAELPKRRVLRTEVELNVLPRGQAPGPARLLELEVDDQGALPVGARLRIRTLDQNGLLVRPAGAEFDFSRSDAWAELPDGLLLVEDGPLPVLSRRLIRSSGPVGVPVRVRATATSLLGFGTLTATLALPLLELPGR